MKVLRNTCALLLFVLLLPDAARGQWVRSGKSRAFSRTNGVATDLSGNVYSAGVFSCIVAFGADSLLNNSCGEITPPAPAVPRTDGFLTKHDENGNLLWAIQLPGSAGNKLFVNDIAVDAVGNCYIAGAYTGSLDLVVSQFTNVDVTTEYFLAKVQPDGIVSWAVSSSIDNASETFAQKVSVTQNAVYITGGVRGKFQIGSLTDSVGRDASFVASFDLNGSPLWAKNFMEVNANGSSRGKALEAQGDSIWVFSSFTDSVQIEATVSRPPGPIPTITAGIICLYNASGLLLNQILTNSPFIEGMRLHRSDAALYITGRAENITAIGGDTLFNSVGTRAYISSHSLDATATLQWAVPFTTGTTSGLTGVDLDVTATGSVLVAGTFTGAVINGLLVSAPGGGGLNGFVCRLDAGGNEGWIQSFGGGGDDALSGISARHDSRVFTAGYFSQYIRVAGDEIYTNAASNGFVARVDMCPQVIAEMISADSTFICQRQTALFQVTADAAYSYQWYHDGSPIAGATNSSLAVRKEGVYRADITSAGCTKLTPVANLFLNPLPDSIVLTNDALQKCMGENVKLSGPIGTYTFQWLDAGVPLPETTKDIVVLTNGDYQVEVTGALGCSILSDTFAIRFFPYPQSSLSPTGGRYTLCSGNTLLLEADQSQAGLTWQWKKDDVPLAGEVSYQYAVTTSGIYSAVIKNSIGCETATEADTVVVQASPLVNLNNEDLPPEICNGNSLRLVTPQVIGQTYQWLRDGIPVTGAVTNILDVATSGQYLVRVNNALCEKISDIFTLTVNPLPSAIITNPVSTTICEGDAYQLHADEAAEYQYQWFNTAQLLSGKDQPLFDITESGNFSVRVTNQFGCQATSAPTAVLVNLKPPAAITALDATTFCEGGSAGLQANPGTSLTYQWYKDGTVINGQTSQSILVTESGTFQVHVTNSNLCVGTSASVSTQKVPFPSATITSISGTSNICERDSLELRAGSSASYDYHWLFNHQALAGKTSANVYAKSPGNYQVVASTGICRDTSVVLALQVRSNPLPVITRNEAFLSIALFGDIQWYRNDEAMTGSNLQAIRVVEDGEYRVNVVNAVGCSAWSEPIPVCLPLPEIQRTNDVLRVSIPAQQYHWEYGQLPITGATLRQVTAQQSGDYSVVVVSDDGCTMETEPVTVCIPYPFIEQDDFSGVLYAFPNPAASYQWYFQGTVIPDGTTQVHIPEQAGEYTVAVRDLDGCVSLTSTFSIEPITSIDRGIQSSLSFYPNPAKDVLTVDRPTGSKKMMLIIVDAAGRTVSKKELTDELQQIDISDLLPGVYIIRVSLDTRSASWKFIRN